MAEFTPQEIDIGRWTAVQAARTILATFTKQELQALTQAEADVIADKAYLIAARMILKDREIRNQ